MQALIKITKICIIIMYNMYFPILPEKILHNPYEPPFNEKTKKNQIFTINGSKIYSNYWN